MIVFAHLLFTPTLAITMCVLCINLVYKAETDAMKLGFSKTRQLWKYLYKKRLDTPCTGRCGKVLYTI